MNKAAIVIIHGFNGEPGDVTYLHEYLTERGMSCYTLKLRGHAADRRAMARYGCNSWIRGVLEDVDMIMPRHKKLCIVGFSMGGLTMLHLNERHAAEKLVFVNTPIYFWNLRQIAVNIVSDLKAGKYGALKFYLCASHSAPLIALLNFVRMLKISVPKLAAVKTKALILQNKDDDTVQPRSAAYIKKKLGDQARIQWFESGGHMMFLNERRDDAAAAIWAFLSESEDT